jgi:predicted dehydrogenase
MEERMTGNTLRIGIAGKRGLSFVSGLRAFPEVQVEAYCERNPQELVQGAQTHGIPRRFADFAAMLDHVDAVIVATPMNLHVPQSLLALQAGKDVLSEVTAAVSLDECWRLRDAVVTSGRTYMMAENYCYMHDNVLVREMARKGLFGELYYGEGEYLHEVRSLHHHPDGSPTWRHYWQVGMRGCTYGTHSLGPIMQWFIAADPQERIASVTCLGTGAHTDPEHRNDDTTLMLCQLRSGKLIKIRLDMLSNRPHLWNYYAVQGTRGVYEASRVDGESGRVWIGSGEPDEHRQWRSLRDFEEHLPSGWRELSEVARKTGHGGGDYHVGRAFAHSLLTGVPPPIDIDLALEWTAAGLCSQISITNGGVPIQVPDFRDPTQRPLYLDTQFEIRS